MSKKSVNDKEIVFPGQYLGVIEEFLPDKNCQNCTYTKKGELYAAKLGFTFIDNRKREISIKTHQEKDRKVVKINDIVIGTVLFLRKYSIGVNFYTINGKIHFNSSYFGNIHVSQISNVYVEKIKDAFQITDIVRAKVVDFNQNEYNLNCVGKNLGVIRADCVICGTMLNKIGFNKLKCSLCGNIETRKMANDYGDPNEILRF